MMAKIKAVYGEEPHREGEYPHAYTVGFDGVASIDRIEENLGEYGLVWFHVYREGRLIGQLNARHVAAVLYFDQETGNA